MKKSGTSLDLKVMKTRNDCEIAFDCVKRANVVLHVDICKEKFRQDRHLLSPQGQHHPSPRIPAVSMILGPHSTYVLRTVGASPALVSGRFEIDSDGGVNEHGVKHPNNKKRAFMHAPPPHLSQNRLP